MAFAGIASGAGSSGTDSGSGGILDKIESAISRWAPTDYSIDLGGSVTVPYFAVGGYNVGGGLSWQVSLENGESSLHASADVGLELGDEARLGIGVGIGFGVADERTSFSYSASIPAEWLPPGVLATIGAAISDYSGIAQAAVLKDDPNNAGLWGTLGNLASAAAANLPSEELEAKFPVSGGVEIGISGGVSTGDGIATPSFEVDHQIWPN